MAEMKNPRADRSACFLPPALCLRFPALKACTEDLPLTLQRPDNFRLVMGILQEINQENERSLESTLSVLQRPPEQQFPTSIMREVKLENVDAEDYHQPMYNNIDSDLHEEWSLKGVEELLIDPDDCHIQAHEAAEHLEVNTLDDKGFSQLQQRCSHFDQRTSDGELPIDEKPSLCSELDHSGTDQKPIPQRVLPFVELNEGLHAFQDVVPANVQTQDKHCQVTQLLPREHVEYWTELRLTGLGNYQAVKREPEEQVQERSILQGGCITKNSAESTAKVCGNKILVHRINARQLNGRSVVGSEGMEIMSTNDVPEHFGKTLMLGHKSQAGSDMANPTFLENVQSSALSEVNLQTVIKKRLSMHNIRRSRNVISALPALLSEQEKDHLGKDKEPNMHATSKSQPTLQGPKCPSVYLIQGEEGEIREITLDDKQQVQPDPWATMESSLHASLQSEQASGVDDSYEKLTWGTLPMGNGRYRYQEEESKLWDEADGKNGQRLRECLIGALERDQQAASNTSMSVAMMPSADACLQAEQASESDEQHEKRMRGTFCVEEREDEDQQQASKPLLRSDEGGQIARKCMNGTSEDDHQAGSSSLKAKEPLRESPRAEQASGCKEPNKVQTFGIKKLHKKMRVTLPMVERLQRDRQRKNEQCHSSDGKGGSGEWENCASDEDAPDRSAGTQSLHVQQSLIGRQAEQASGFAEPDKKRMRGTLLMEAKQDGEQNQERKRCHRSDGKSWRCNRECINGAYYCQYHLRARRIGYNRRKARDTNAGNLDSMLGRKSL